MFICLPFWGREGGEVWGCGGGLGCGGVDSCYACKADRYKLSNASSQADKW